MTRMKRAVSSQPGLPLERCFKILLGITLVLFVVFATNFSSGYDAGKSSIIQAKEKDTSRLNEEEEPRELVRQSINNVRPTIIENNKDNNKPLRIAYIGNSILYYNDSPGLIAAMISASGRSIEYDACMTGGASFSSMATGRSGCTRSLQISKGLLTIQKLMGQPWDYIILQDQTKAPSILETRKYHLQMLNQTYAGPIAQSGATPIFMQTAGYKNPRENYEPMTQQLHDGYHAYADLLTQELQKRSVSAAKQAQVAPVGEAYRELRKTNNLLWRRLYMDDGVHPTAKATWFQACVLYCSILKTDPPPYDPAFWKKPSGEMRTSQALPTEEEAQELRQMAMKMTGVVAQS